MTRKLESSIVVLYFFPLILNQDEIYFPEIDKQAFVYSYSNVDDAFGSCGGSLSRYIVQTVEYASKMCGFWQCRDSIYTCLDDMKPDCWSLFPQVYGTEEEWSAHGTQQQGFLMQCFDNVRAPSRLLCEVLLNNLVI